MSVKILKEMELKKIRYMRRKLKRKKRIKLMMDKPRISIYRSLKHFYAQLIDDTKAHTLASASTLSPEIREKLKGLTKTEKSQIVATLLAEKMKKLNITEAVIDIGGRKYHGRIKAFVEKLREEGIRV